MACAQSVRACFLSIIKRISRFLVKTISFAFDFLFFFYAVYASALFFAVILMFFAAILFTIYISLLSGNLASQFYSLLSGVTMVGFLNVLADKELTLLLRLLQKVFGGNHWDSVLLLMVTPVSMNINDYSDKHSRLRNFILKIRKKFSSNAFFNGQRIFTLIIVLFDLIVLVCHLFGYSCIFKRRSLIAICFAILASLLRLIQSIRWNTDNTTLPLSKKLHSLFTNEFSLAYYKYTTFNFTVFILLSASLAGANDKLFEFPLTSCAILVFISIAVFVIFYFVLPRCLKDSVSSSDSGLCSAPATKRIDNPYVPLTYMMLMLLALLVSLFFRAWDVSDTLVKTRTRVLAVLSWFFIIAVSIVHLFCDWRKVDTSQSTDNTKEDASHSPTASATDSPEITYGGAAATDVQNLSKQSKQDKIMMISIAIFFILSLLILFTGLLASFDTSLSDPPKEWKRISHENLLPPYGICQSRWGRFNITDLALISAATYYTRPSDVLSHWFDYPFSMEKIDNVTGFEAFHLIFPRAKRKVVSGLPLKFFERNLHKQYLTLTANLGPDAEETFDDAHVIAIRGSAKGKDWLQNGYIWGDSVFFSLFSFFSPFSVTDEVTSILVYLSRSLRYGVFGDVSYFSALRAKVEDVVNSYSNASMIIVGHSLGGGLAQLLGASLKLRTVAFSSVGIGYQDIASSFPIEASRAYLTNIQSNMDLIPLIDLQLGNLQNIRCDQGYFTCHSMKYIYKELASSCGDDRYLGSVSKSEGIPWSWPLQLVLWLIMVMLSLIRFFLKPLVKSIIEEEKSRKQLEEMAEANALSSGEGEANKEPIQVPTEAKVPNEARETTFEANNTTDSEIKIIDGNFA